MSHFDILIVEDHPMMIRSITASLAVLHPQAHADCGVVIVGSLMQAKKRLLRRREPPSLVIADLNLPDSRGLATLRALREVAPGIAIVVFSASDDKSTEQAALDLGAQAFISKSALPQNFVQKLQPFLPGSATPCALGLSVPASEGRHHITPSTCSRSANVRCWPRWPVAIATGRSRCASRLVSRLSAPI